MQLLVYDTHVTHQSISVKVKINILLAFKVSNQITDLKRVKTLAAYNKQMLERKR